MANFRRLSAFLRDARVWLFWLTLLAGAFVADRAIAATYNTYSGNYCAPGGSAAGPSCSTQYAAYTFCQSQTGSTGYGCTGPYADSGMTYYQQCFNGSCSSYNVYVFTGTPQYCTGGATIQSNGLCGTSIPTQAQCLALNKPLSGDTDGRGLADRWFVQGLAPTTYCAGGCEINVYITDKAPVQGINPFTGQPTTWTVHHQEATGSGIHDGKCSSANQGADQSGNPENSMADPSTQPPKTPPEWNCNFQKGTCLDPNGNENYCTFSGVTTNPDGTPNYTNATRNTCTLAKGDADGDGIPNDKDPAPTDPKNGQPTPANDGGKTSTGGGSCTAPPQSSGDGIAAQIAFQTWATRCAVDKLREQVVYNNESGGALDPADSAKLASIQAATAANVTASNSIKDKMDTLIGATGAAASASNGTTAAVNDLKDALMGDVPDPGPAGDSVSVDAEGRGGDAVVPGEGLDTSVLSAGPASCPVIAPITVMSMQVTIPVDKICEWLRLGAILVVLSATILSLKILGTMS